MFDVFIFGFLISLVIGENVEEETCCDRNGNQERESFTVSSIRKPNNELKTLVTPGILQSDQPNDIIVNLSEGII